MNARAIPVGAEVLVAWPGFPVFVSRVLGASHDRDGTPMYLVRDAEGQSWWVMERTMTDLGGIDRPPCALARQGGRA